MNALIACAKSGLSSERQRTSTSSSVIAAMKTGPCGRASGVTHPSTGTAPTVRILIRSCCPTHTGPSTCSRERALNEWGHLSVKKSRSLDKKIQFQASAKMSQFFARFTPCPSPHRVISLPQVFFYSLLMVTEPVAEGRVEKLDGLIEHFRFSSSCGLILCIQRIFPNN